MRKRKPIPRIEVRTAPNGYELSFDKQRQPRGFFYFKPEQLVEGVMLHIGLGMNDQIDRSQIHSFIEAATTFTDHHKSTAEIVRLKGEVKLQRQYRDSSARKAVADHNRCVAIIQEVKDVMRRFKDLADVHDRLAAVVAPYSNLREYSIREYSIREFGLKLDDDEDNHQS